MRLNGKKVEGVNEVEIIIPRGNDISNAIVLRARAIQDWEILEKLLPQPKPRVKILPGGKRELDEKSEEYIKRREVYYSRRSTWIVLESLKATEDLQWDSIDLGKPETWDRFEQEMKDAGFSFVETQKIIMECMAVNALNESMLDKARADFISFRQKQAEMSSFQEDEPDSTQSGEPANASESSLPASSESGSGTPT